MSDRIITTHYPPPIGTRSMDWRATRDSYGEDGPVGEGRTEAEAVEDLMEKER